MPLAAGTRLGPYEILALIGAGGMGEVYRGKDTRLDRIVAIKVLPAHLAANAEFRQRLEREARAVASLNHPHICQLYDIGRQDGVDFLVLEYLEGETLAARLAKEPMPLEQALRYAVQIADALDKAHRKGVSHRDLKPGNIMLTKAGAKLLDFGLAKMTRATTDAAVSSVPTQDVALTAVGTILGTMQYMSPEQLQGRDADARSDIFAFGAVLYEMIAGRKAFEGSTPASVAGAILHTEPPAITTLQPMSPPSLDRLVRTCLAKDPDDRWQSAHDLMLELEAVGAAGGVAVAPARVAAGSLRSRLLWATAGALAATVALSVGLWLRPQPQPQVLKLSLLPPEKTALGDPVAISPDGRRVAFTAGVQGRLLLWVRPLDSLEAQPLAGTEGAILPFWSPDSRFLGFFAQGKLKKIEVAGGPAQTLCDAGAAAGGAWNRDGVIAFAPARTGGLYRVSAAGGLPAPLTTLNQADNETSHRWPYFLPDGRRFLYFARSGQRDKYGVFAASLDAPGSKDAKRVLVGDSMALYAPPGFLLFLRESTLMAQRFDAGKLEFSGDPFPVAERASRSPLIGFGAFSASATGVLAYRSGAAATTQLTWFDRAGKTLGMLGPPGSYTYVRLSPDEKRVVVANPESPGSAADLWLFDLARGDSTKFTFHPGTDWAPVWSPDGTRIAFASDRDGIQNIYQKLASGAADEEPLLKTGDIKFPADWSRDGRFLVYESISSKSLRDLWVLPLEGDRKPIPFLLTEFVETQARFSPDGRWIAYASEEAGAPEVYVQPFPASGGKWKVSTSGGANPEWRGDGKEMFYLAADRKLMAVDIKVGGTKDRPALEVGTPRPLFQTSGSGLLNLYNHYAVTRNGQRFLITSLKEEAASAPITVVVNWLPRN
jgi:Tol biopolymer transport system component